MNNQLFYIARHTYCADCGCERLAGALVSVDTCPAGYVYRCPQCAMVPYQPKIMRPIPSDQNQPIDSYDI